MTSIAPPRSARPDHLPAPGERVFVGLSGGVDSAVALHLLAARGCRVEALFVKSWEEDDGPGYCAAAEDLADARAVCEVLGVRLRTVNLAYEYWERVFERFLAEHARGRTPNPDVLCNREVKFRAFLEHARDLGAQRIATGHYAGLAHRDGRWRLLRSADPDKDQTYFLHALDQGQLASACFPLAHLDKPAVRRIAREAGLPVHAKRDSTGICFIGERPLRSFLRGYLEPEPGDIESVAGERLGRHAGLAFYTIGQRQGLGLGGRRGGTGAPWYVAAKDLERNVLVVAPGRDHPALWACGLRAAPPHWVAGPPGPALPLRCEARIRHRQALQGCEVRVAAHPPGGIEVRFDEPQWAVAPGQSVVLYDGAECLGGAVIEAPDPAPAPAIPARAAG